MEICNKRLSFPLSTLSAQSFCQDNLALIGDAAHSIHPMAGQGLNMGLLDSEILANNICSSLSKGKRFELEENLFSYERKAKINNYSMQAGVEAIKMSYAIDSPLFSKLRNIGVSVIQNTPLRNLTQDVAAGSFFSSQERLWKD